MFTGFNLRLDRTASIFSDEQDFRRLEEVGQNHLEAQKAILAKE